VIIREKILNHETRYNITRDIFVIYIFKSWISFWSQKRPLIIYYLHLTYFQTITKKTSTRMLYTYSRIIEYILIPSTRIQQQCMLRTIPYHSHSKTVELLGLGTRLYFTNIKTSFNMFEHYFCETHRITLK